MAGKINLIVRLQNWMDSVPGQTFLNYAYSWGASIVILGALFKLTHIQGGNIMLFIGMGTEVVVFFLSAFDRPFDKTEVGKELPEELETEEEMAERLGLNEEPTPESDDLPLVGEEPAEASPQTHIHMANEQADLAESEQNATAVAAAAQAAQGSTGSTGGAPAGLQGVAAGGGGTIIIGGGVAPGVAAATQDPPRRRTPQPAPTQHKLPPQPSPLLHPQASNPSRTKHNGWHKSSAWPTTNSYTAHRPSSRPKWRLPHRPTSKNCKHWPKPSPRWTNKVPA